MNDKEHNYTTVSKMLTMLCAAIEFQGHSPRHHQDIILKTRQDWPTLMNAVDAILRVAEKRSISLSMYDDFQRNINARINAGVPEHAVATFFPHTMTTVYTWYELQEQHRD